MNGAGRRTLNPNWPNEREPGTEYFFGQPEALNGATLTYTVTPVNAYNSGGGCDGPSQ